MVFAGKLTHFLRDLPPIDSRKLAEILTIRQREALKVMLDVSESSNESSFLATLGLQQGGMGLCHLLDIVNPAFVVSSISSVTELQIAYPDIKDIQAERQ